MKINTHKEEENSYEITNTDRNGPLWQWLSGLVSFTVRRQRHPKTISLEDEDLDHGLLQ